MREMNPRRLGCCRGVCEGDAGVRQCESDSGITQINAKPNHVWWFSPSWLMDQRLESLVNLGGVHAATLSEVRLAAATAAEDLGCASNEISRLIPCLRAASLVATATMGLPSSFTPERATTTGFSSPSWPRTQVRSCAVRRRNRNVRRSSQPP